MNNQTDYSRYTPPQQQSSSRTWLYVIIGLVAVCLCCALIAVAVIALGGVGVFTLFSEAQDLTNPMNGYMTAMAVKDEEAALTYFASTSRVSREDLRTELSARNFVKYDGFESASVNSFSTETSGAITSADIGGTIQYSNGDTAEFSATLRKQDGVWKLQRLPDIDLP